MSHTIHDGSLSGGVPGIVAFRPVAADVFLVRAERFATLARGHRLEAYLAFASRLSRAQHIALQSLPYAPVADERTVAQCIDHGLPVLSADGHRRDAVWREGLQTLVNAVDRASLPDESIKRLQDLATIDSDALEAAAGSLLSGNYSDVESASSPFIGAALQVYWVKMGLQLGMNGVNEPPQIGLCPLCGSPPVASVVRVGGAQQGLRYLLCSLCCCEWHMVRVKCAACGSTKGVSYLGVERASAAVKAECCDECRTYLKIFYLEKDTAAVPAADDLASLDLDILVDDAGYRRIAPNLLLSPGLS
jgi:FdhE protein